MEKFHKDTRRFSRIAEASYQYQMFDQYWYLDLSITDTNTNIDSWIWNHTDTKIPESTNNNSNDI